MVEHTELKSIRESFVTIIYNGTNTPYTVLGKFGKIIASGKDMPVSYNPTYIVALKQYEHVFHILYLV
jgi:hypothetical protein